MNTTQPYEDLARLLANAYTTGDKNAIRELNWMRGTSFVWEHEPEKMQQRLTNWYAAAQRSDTLALEDARNMVARSYGFANWEKLQAGAMNQPADPRSVKEYRSLVPPFFTINWKENAITVNGGPQPLQYWEKIFELIGEYALTGLNASEISEEAMQRLPQQLTKLASGGITDDGLRHLARMPQLQNLDLGNWRGVLTDRGLEVLRHLKNLRRFEIVWAQQITDAGIENLSGCDQLERVNLFGTNTGDGAIKALAGKKNLHHFSAGMMVTDGGIDYLHQFPVFKEWQGGTIKYDLMAFEGEPNHLMLGGTYSDAGIARLAGLNGLFGLTFLGNKSNISANGIAALSALPRLGFFSIDGEKCTDEVMDAIGRLPHLRMLLAQGNIATNKGFAALSRSQTIEYIWGRDCPNLGNAGFKALSAMTALKGLAVSCKFVQDEALASLPAFPALKALMPMDVSDDAFRHIGRCEQLEDLWCMYCREITDLATVHIAGLKNLKRYYAGQTWITDSSLEILGKMDSLEKLTFWNISGITAKGVKALTRLPRLREVNFECCINITQEDTAIFPGQVQVHYSA